LQILLLTKAWLERASKKYASPALPLRLASPGGLTACRRRLPGACLEQHREPIALCSMQDSHAGLPSSKRQAAETEQAGSRIRLHVHGP